MHKVPALKVAPISGSILEKNEKIQSWFQRLIQKSQEGAIIIVEGKKDAKALERLGVIGPIFCIKTKRTSLPDALHRFVDIKNELIILVDFDRTGHRLVGKIVKYLERSGKSPNLHFWMKIHGLTYNDIKDVEGLVSYTQNIENKVV
ncbi:MAG: toprim domain-containing protein [Candidatus Bathyarchaeota archaeon]